MLLDVNYIPNTGEKEIWMPHVFVLFLRFSSPQENLHRFLWKPETLRKLYFSKDKCYYASMDQSLYNHHVYDAFYMLSTFMATSS